MNVDNNNQDQKTDENSSVKPDAFKTFVDLVRSNKCQYSFSSVLFYVVLPILPTVYTYTSAWIKHQQVAAGELAIATAIYAIALGLSSRQIPILALSLIIGIFLALVGGSASNDELQMQLKQAEALQTARHIVEQYYAGAHSMDSADGTYDFRTEMKQLDQAQVKYSSSQGMELALAQVGLWLTFLLHLVDKFYFHFRNPKEPPLEFLKREDTP